MYVYICIDLQLARQLAVGPEQQARDGAFQGARPRPRGARGRLVVVLLLPCGKGGC